MQITWNKPWKRFCGRRVFLALVWAGLATARAGLDPVGLRVEYLDDPVGLDATQPRLSWRVESGERGQVQTAYQILVARSVEKLERHEGDLWDSGKVETNRSIQVVYQGQPLASGDWCFWKVRVWDKEGQPSSWSPPSRWTMGLLHPEDWAGAWISHRDTSPLHKDRQKLFLPAARHFRKEFVTDRRVTRAILHATAQGIFEWHLNGQRVGDAYFAPGWPDYHQRGYYTSYDVTSQLREGRNALGVILAEGWYSGYVGYGVLVGYGPDKVGRYFYGKTPALSAQLELVYEDGSRERVVTDTSWQVTGEGPFREADLIMGESYDARMEMPGWSEPGFVADRWEQAILASQNGSTKAVFHDGMGPREVELGFQKPARLQAYPGPPIRVTEELPARKLSEPQPGLYVFDLGQNMAGLIRLKVKGEAGLRIRIRYGEMLHPDGRLMTENLRRARATDYYVLKGDPAGEIWSPRFTYHGFQFVELSGLKERPGLEAVTGLVLHSDTPLASEFECSDPLVNRLYHNVVWTQRANFIEIPTDCPQRDERLGWMGDAQAYVGTAAFNADVAAFFTKWLDDVEEAQRSFGAYPDYAPYPMAHGQPRKTFGTAWMDAGIICPWHIHRAYGDTRVLERHYASMQRFMEFRMATSPNFLGVSLGNPWGDWLALNEVTPVEFVDVCYYAWTARLMSEMAAALGREVDVTNYRQLYETIRAAFGKEYLQPDGSLKVQTQTAYVLALAFGLIPVNLESQAAAHLTKLIEANGTRMATGFLGTKPLLPVLTTHGHHDLAVRLLQSRQFPSWLYPVVNGATTVWERWDSYTKEDGFGRHNAAMNSFSHYAFGAVCEWMFRELAGIDTELPGFQQLRIHPGPPRPDSNPDQKPIDWVRASYDSIHGRIRTHWRVQPGRFELEVTIPPNATAKVFLPARDHDRILEGGQPIDQNPHVARIGREGDRTILRVDSGTYRLEAVQP